MPLHFCCGAAVLGHVLYALAYRADWLYLVLVGRVVSGCSFTFWMYSKRYCSDHRLVGVRRRTALAGWLVLGQGVGFSFGPFVGGLLCVRSFSLSAPPPLSLPDAESFFLFWVLGFGFWFTSHVGSILRLVIGSGGGLTVCVSPITTGTTTLVSGPWLFFHSRSSTSIGSSTNVKLSRVDISPPVVERVWVIRLGRGARSYTLVLHRNH